MDEENCDKLTLEEQCSHKSWKIRINGYTVVVQHLKKDYEQSSELTKNIPNIIKKIVTENNDPALEKGLDVIMVFLDKSPEAKDTAHSVMPFIVKRCLASSRHQTRAISIEICYKYIEIGKQNVVLHELLEGTNTKIPKIVLACNQVMIQIVKLFGAKIFDIRPLLERLVTLLEDRDANIRNSSKALVVELYKWIGPSLKPYLNRLKPSKLSEVVSDIAKIEDLIPVPTRFLRSELDQSPNEPSSISQKHNSSIISEQPDPFDTLQPEDVISKIPTEFFNLVRSPKWSERKDALQTLENILSKPKRIKNGEFTELIVILKNIIAKDTNVLVVVLAIKCITFIAAGLRGELGSHVPIIFKTLLEKLKEKRMAVVAPLREAMDTLLKCSSIDALSTDLVSGLQHKNPCVKSETALFLSRCFSSEDLNKKCIKPLIVSLAGVMNDQDPTVRNSAANALGVAVRIVGEPKLVTILENIDNQKILKIRDYAYKSCSDVNKPDKSIDLNIPPSSGDRAPKSIDNNILPSSGERPSVQTKSLETSTERNLSKPCNTPVIKNDSIRGRSTTDQSKKYKGKLKEESENQIPEAIILSLPHRNWEIRLQAISDLKKFIEDIKRPPNNLGEIVAMLSSRILDKNPKVATSCISLVTTLAANFRSTFGCHIPTFLPAILKCIGDSRKSVSQPAINCLDSLLNHCGSIEIFKCGALREFLKSGSQTSRVRLWEWISKTLSHTLEDMPKEELENYLLPLFMSLEDRNQEVRNSAGRAVKILMTILGSSKVLSSCEKYSKGRKNPLTKLLLDEGEVLKLGCVEIETEIETSTNSSPTKEVNKFSTFSENEGRPVLLGTNNLKHQRVIDENKNKIIKWEFTVPRSEFVDLLKSLMIGANFSQHLMNYMFHDDFKFQITAMDMLLDELQHNSQAVVSNLDIILRWLTIRLFDTCPAVLVKGLDFLHRTLDILDRIGYCFLDSEISILVPYLVIKMCDSRDNVQVKIKEILFKLTSLYPVSKLKKFVMDGLRTRNVRQKACCLEVLLTFINNYGESVYSKDINAVTEHIVKHLKDRDPVIKKRAYCVVASLFSQGGDKFLELVEKYAGKEMAKIEERIRKLAEARRACDGVSQQRSIPCTPDGCADVPTCALNSTIEDVDQETRYKREVLSEEVENPGMFKLETEVLKECDSVVSIPIVKPNLVEVNIDFLKDDKLAQNLCSFNSIRSCKLLDSHLSLPDNLINDIINDSSSLSIRAIKEIDELFTSGKCSFSSVDVDLIVDKISQKLSELSQTNDQDECFPAILALLSTICGTKKLIDGISRTNLCFLLERLLSLICNIFNDRYKAAINKIILKILVNGRKTDLLCGLLEMMCQSKVASAGGKIHELHLKCMWRLNRTQSFWDAELDYSEVFKSMRMLVKTYNLQSWSTKLNNDDCLRTMKAVLRTMIKSRGDELLKELKTEVSSAESSGLDIYLRKLLRSTKLKNQSSMSVKNLLKSNMLFSHVQELSDIFKMLSLDPVKGMEQLNKFIRDHPEVDMHRVISRISPVLSEYFNGNNYVFESTPSNIENIPEKPTITEDFSEEAQRLKNRLRVLQQRISSYNTN